MLIVTPVPADTSALKSTESLSASGSVSRCAPPRGVFVVHQRVHWIAVSEKYGGHCFRHREADTSRVRYFRDFERLPGKSYDITVNGTQGGESRVHNPRMQMQRRLFLSLTIRIPAAVLAQQGCRSGAESRRSVCPDAAECGRSHAEARRCEKGRCLYDLGSGDGRMVITAAKMYGVKGTGIDIDPQAHQGSE